MTAAEPGGPQVVSPGAGQGTGDGSFRDALGASPGTALIAGLTTAWLILLFLDPGPPFDLVALAYLLVVPGLAVTRAAGLRTSAASLSLGVVLSMALVGLLQALMIAAGSASPLLLRALIVILVLGALVVDEYLASPSRAVTLERLADPDEAVARTHRVG